MQDVSKQREVVRTWIKLEKYLSEFQTEEEMKKHGDYSRTRVGSSYSKIRVKRPSSSKMGRSVFGIRSGSGANMRNHNET